MLCKNTNNYLSMYYIIAPTTAQPGEQPNKPELSWRKSQPNNKSFF